MQRETVGAMWRAALAPLLVLALASAGGAWLAPPAAASVGIGVAPALVELEVVAGGRVSQEIVVSNSGDQPFEATAGVAPLDGAEATRSAADWITIEPASFRLRPHHQQTIRVTVAVPGGLPTGGYYALVTVETGATATDADAGSAGIAGRLGVPLLFTARGEGRLDESAALTRFAPVLEPDGRIGFRALVRGTGNTYVQTQGKIEVTAADGRHVASLEFPPSGRILPNVERLVHARGSLPLPRGQTFRATATLTSGDNQPPLTATATFAVAPAQAAIARLDVCENMDKGPTLGVAFRNDGDVALQPTVTLSVRSVDGASPGETALPPPLLWPKATTTLQAVYAERLESGRYLAVVTARIGDAPPMARELTFQIGDVGGNPVPLCPSAAPGA